MLYFGYQQSDFKPLRQFADSIINGVDISSLRKKRKERWRSQKGPIKISTAVRVPSPSQQRVSPGNVIRPSSARRANRPALGRSFSLPPSPTPTSKRRIPGQRNVTSPPFTLPSSDSPDAAPWTAPAPFSRVGQHTPTRDHLDTVHISRKTDEKIQRKICEDLSDVRDRKIGVVYILRDPTHSERFKIGVTAKGSEARNDEIRRNCETDLEVVYTIKPIMSASRAEQLCHAELANLRDLTARSKCYKCRKSGSKTHVQHTEYFFVSFALAKRTVDRWAQFISEKPYDSKGMLKKFWLAKVHGLDPCLEAHDDDARHRRWNRFMCLTTLERYIHAPLASNEYVLVTTWRYRLPLLLVLLRGVSTAFWSHPSLYNSLLVTILAIMTMHALLKLANTVLVFFGPEIKPSPRKQRTVQVD